MVSSSSVDPRRDSTTQRMEHQDWSVINALSAHIAVLNSDGIIIAVNRAWRDFAAANPPIKSNVAEGANYLRVCDTAQGDGSHDARAFAAGIRAVMSGERESFALEYAAHSPTQQQWFVGKVTRLTDGSGRVVVAHENITQRKQSEERYRLLFENANAAILLADDEAHYLEVNHYAELLTGYSKAELLTMRVMDLTADRVPDQGRSLYEQFKRDETMVGEYWIRRKDGTEIPVEFAATRIAPGYYQSILRDISEHRRTEEQLREQSEILATINQIGQVLSAELDLQKLVQAVTDAATELTGAKFGSFFYNVVDDRGPSYMLYTLSGVPREHFSNFPMPRATDLFGPTFRGEGVIRIANVRHDPRYGKNSPYYGIPPGHLPVVSYLAVPVVSRSGEVLGGLFFGHPEPDVFRARHEQIIVGLAAQTAIAIDNARLYAAVRESAETLRQQVEERTAALQAALSQAQGADRMKTALVATANHELRAPLTSIIGFSNLILERNPGPAKNREYVANINSEARRLLDLVEDFLDLQRLESGRTTFQMEALDLAALIRDILSKQRLSDDNRHDIRLDLPNVSKVYADEHHIRRVIVNLLSNAIKFSPHGGVITLAVRETADQVICSVSDPGLGLSAEELDHLFEHFNRGLSIEKRRIRGTGLGLALCREIIQAHGGQIWADSAGLGQGATFTFTLPTLR